MYRPDPARTLAPSASRDRPLQGDAPAIAPRRARVRAVRCLVPLALLAATVKPTLGTDCGGAVVCACGDRVVRDTVLSADVGPCAWGADPTELVGLRIDSNVTLDCAHHAIRGPADAMKQEFGVKFGSASRPVAGATLRNCDVSGFWWGVYVASSTAITVEDNSIHDNGWKDPLANGTGYGIDVTGILPGLPSDAIVIRRNHITDNGNEGIHLSTSTGVEIAANELADNGKEQLYLLGASGNAIHDNAARRGTQGLEMRDSPGNALSYNRWLESPLQLLEGASVGNDFVYDEFEGELKVGANATANAFSFARLANATGACADVSADATTFRQSWFADCATPLGASAATVVDRCVGLPPARPAAPIVSIHPGCNGDLDGNGVVDALDAAAVAAAAGTVPGATGWNPAADLDRDGAVGAADQAVVALQAGPCPERNLRPKPKLRAVVVSDGASGTPDVVLLDAGASSDPDGRLLRYRIEVKDRLSKALVASADLLGAAPDAARLQASFPPGLYLSSLVVSDAYWQPSRVVKRQFKVR